MGLAGQIIYLPKEDKQDKTLRELMLMQALPQTILEVLSSHLSKSG